MCVCMCMPPSGILKPASPGQCLVCSGKICDKLRERVNSLAKFHAEMPSHIPSKKWMRAWPDPASLCPEKQEGEKRKRRTKMSSCTVQTPQRSLHAVALSLPSLPIHLSFLLKKMLRGPKHTSRNLLAFPTGFCKCARKTRTEIYRGND